MAPSLRFGREAQEIVRKNMLFETGTLRHNTLMGLSPAKISLDNPRLPSLQPIQVEALADTGALFLCLPDHVAAQLQLRESSKKEVTTADGRRQLCPYVGPVHVQFQNRECYVGAVVLGDEVLLGAVPMEDMDLVVVPSEKRVAVNPLNPNFAAGRVKGVRTASTAYTQKSISA
jgi:clan AA aspartic protease